MAGSLAKWRARPECDISLVLRGAAPIYSPVVPNECVEAQALVRLQERDDEAAQRVDAALDRLAQAHLARHVLPMLRARDLPLSETLRVLPQREQQDADQVRGLVQQSCAQAADEWQATCVGMMFCKDLQTVRSVRLSILSLQTFL